MPRGGDNWILTTNSGIHIQQEIQIPEFIEGASFMPNCLGSLKYFYSSPVPVLRVGQQMQKQQSDNPSILQYIKKNENNETGHITNIGVK